MPALPPPSMQIAGLPNGMASVSPLPSGPALQYGFNTAPASLVQQVANHSTSAAPASFTLSGITATKAGSYLVALVAVAESGAASVSTPTNWTAVPGSAGDSAGHTIGGRIFVYPNNPGGITSVAFSTLSGVNGIAVSFFEWANVYALDGNYVATASYSNGSTAPSAAAYTPSAGPALLIGFECDLTGQAYTAANTGLNWVAGTTTTSTTGATNAIIRPFYVLTTPELNVPYQLKGTLAGSIANGTSLVSLLCGTSGPLSQPQPETVLTGAWGGLGGTKPGGAGSGQ